MNTHDENEKLPVTEAEWMNALFDRERDFAEAADYADEFAPRLAEYCLRQRKNKEFRALHYTLYALAKDGGWKGSVDDLLRVAALCLPTPQTRPSSDRRRSPTVGSAHGPREPDSGGTGASTASSSDSATPSAPPPSGRSSRTPGSTPHQPERR